MNLDEFLKKSKQQEEKKQMELSAEKKDATADKTGEKRNENSAERHFVIDDDEDDVIETPSFSAGSDAKQDKKEETAEPSDDIKENPKLAAAVAEATKQLGETYNDSSSDEEEQKESEKKAATVVNPLASLPSAGTAVEMPFAVKKDSPRPEASFRQVFFKGNRVETMVMEQLMLQHKLHFIATRKEVKNKTIKNLLSSQEDRFLCLLDFSTDAQKQHWHLVVLKKCSADAAIAKKHVSNFFSLAKGQFEKQIQSYTQSESNIIDKETGRLSNPYVDNSNPYIAAVKAEPEQVE